MLLLLRALEPRFIRCETRIADEAHGRDMGSGEIQWGGFEIDVLNRVATLADADGIAFLCPKCFLMNRGPIGTHQVMVFFEGKNAPAHIGLNSRGAPERWRVIGSDFLDLTLDPSILLGGGCRWHGWVKHGVIEHA